MEDRRAVGSACPRRGTACLDIGSPRAAGLAAASVTQLANRLVQRINWRDARAAAANVSDSSSTSRLLRERGWQITRFRRYRQHQTVRRIDLGEFTPPVFNLRAFSPQDDGLRWIQQLLECSEQAGMSVGILLDPFPCCTHSAFRSVEIK